MAMNDLRVQLAHIAFLLAAGGSLFGGEIHEVQVDTPSDLNRHVPFYYRTPAASVKNGGIRGVLLLVPGCNGDGRALLQESGPWAGFANQQALVLVAPTFKTTLDEVHSRHGYYYPELWSGRATLLALDEIGKRLGVKTDKVLLFGFSAGAHFVHRFTLWKPEKVKAFVAYSAGWWDAPAEKLRQTPALIMCGESDERYEATRALMDRAQQLRLPWIWRSYAGVGHQLTPQVLKMAQAFLGYYARPENGESFVGDMQSYQYLPAESRDVERIPKDLQVKLPSKAVAEAWKMEN